MTKPIPEGLHSITPHLVVDNAAQAIEFYKKAFGAEELGRAPSPDGRLMHAAIRIGDSTVFLADDFPDWGMPIRAASKLPATPVTLNLYVENADATFERAVKAGATVTIPLEEMFWGDRYGKVRDPFGHEWAIATRIKDLSPEEIQKAGEALFSQPAGK